MNSVGTLSFFFFSRGITMKVSFCNFSKITLFKCVVYHVQVLPWFRENVNFFFFFFFWGGGYIKRLKKK